MKTIKEKLIHELHELEMEQVKLECEIKKTFTLAVTCIPLIALMSTLILLKLISLI